MRESFSSQNKKRVVFKQTFHFALFPVKTIAFPGVTLSLNKKAGCPKGAAGFTFFKI